MSMAERVPFEQTTLDAATEISVLDTLAGATSVLELLRRADDITPEEIDLWAALVVDESPRLYVHAPRQPSPAVSLALAESMAEELKICTGAECVPVTGHGQTQTSCLRAYEDMLNEMSEAWRDHITHRGEAVVGLTRAAATDPRDLTIDRWRRTDEVLSVTAWMLGALTDEGRHTPGVIDPITGAHTRMFFEAMLDHELRLQMRVPSELSVVLLQVRSSNPVMVDQPVPPAVLATTAMVMQATLRASDVVARLDERRLAAILPGTGPRHGLMAATRVGEALRDCHELEGWSVDVGVSGVGIETMESHELIEQATHAMLAAEKGRAQTPFVSL